MKKAKRQPEIRQTAKSGRPVQKVVLGLGTTLVCLAIAAALFSFRTPATASAGPKAAIIDQLDLSFSNPEFISSATNILEYGGYKVDHFSGTQVTLDLYRRLPSLGYQLIVLRAHTPRFIKPNGVATNEIALLTGEPLRRDSYSKKETDLLTVFADPKQPELNGLVGVKEGFVEEMTVGNFQGATVVLMGCGGLRSDLMARAFVARGAREIIGWDEDVAGEFTDRATELFLNHLLVDKMPGRIAVSMTMEEMGPDPTYGGRMSFYPR